MSETTDFRDEPIGRGLANVKGDLDAMVVENRRLAEEIALLKCTDNDGREEWLKCYGFKIFVTLKHGPIGDVLVLLQDGWISRGKACEAIAEMLLGNRPELPEIKASAFDDLELPGETVVNLRQRVSELTDALAPFANHQAERLEADRTRIITYSALSDDQWQRALEAYTHE